MQQQYGAGGTNVFEFHINYKSIVSDNFHFNFP